MVSCGKYLLSHGGRSLAGGKGLFFFNDPDLILVPKCLGLMLAARRFTVRSGHRYSHSGFVILKRPNPFIPSIVANASCGASYTELGKKYEELTAEFLKACFCTVTLCGGAGDHGIDFRGFWNLPDRTLPIVGAFLVVNST